MHLTFKGASTYTNLAAVCVVLLLVGIQQSGQTEVGDLDVIGRLHQHVPSSQVSVDQPPFLQVHHALKEKGNTTASFIQGPFYLFKSQDCSRHRCDKCQHRRGCIVIAVIAVTPAQAFGSNLCFL